MNYLEIVKKVLTNPKEFYKSVKKEDKILKPWLYFVILASILLFFSVISSVVSVIYQTANVDPNLQTLSMGVQLLITIFATIFGGIVGFFSIFISIGILHLFLMIVKTKKEFVETVKVVCYSYTANLFMIPVILIFTAMELLFVEELIKWVIYGVLWFIVFGYNLYLTIVGIMELHELSLMKALTATVFIPLAILIVIITIIGLIMLFFGIFITSLIGNPGDITGMVTNLIV
jgi:hypothetical protein